MSSTKLSALPFLGFGNAIPLICTPPGILQAKSKHHSFRGMNSDTQLRQKVAIPLSDSTYSAPEGVNC